ncbi:MAG: hypothetical protein WC748_09650 [Legionellales bacterium]|jgi:hypothetical protein
MAVQNTPEQIQAAEALRIQFAAKRPDQYAQMIGSATTALMTSALATTFELAGVEARVKATTNLGAGQQSSAFPAETKNLQAQQEVKIERPEQNRTNIPLMKN